MKTKDGGPAFPGVRGEYGHGESSRQVAPDGSFIWTEHNQGMSLRDYFAAKADVPWNAALETLAIRHPSRCGKFTVGEVAAMRATIKYAEADAMLAEREKLQTVAPVDVAAEVERVLADFEAKHGGTMRAQASAELVAGIRAVISEKGGV